MFVFTELVARPPGAFLKRPILSKKLAAGRSRVQPPSVVHTHTQPALYRVLRRLGIFSQKCACPRACVWGHLRRRTSDGPRGLAWLFLVEMLRTGTSRLELVLELVVKRSTTGRTGGERKEK